VDEFDKTGLVDTATPELGAEGGQQAFTKPSVGSLQSPVTPDKTSKKPGRNDPCPCGSGKKYKRCHYPQQFP